ncbi:DUF1684 domain-containing protein [Ostreiculturibacter nitratireducens]|uniref:DUF1684 domain-containing protein n=1 Tax=Ostreiculturibacter nitratireducens TaxID=3075226 RepID=UPI0031B56D60
MDADAWSAALEDWRAARLAALKADDGWLNLTDRIEITPGRHSVGTGPENDLRISAGPAHLGTLILTRAGVASFRLPGGEEEDFGPRPDAPPRLVVDSVLLEIHRVEGHPALRVRDLRSRARESFAGLRHFPPDPAWVIRADWIELDKPAMADVALVDGRSEKVQLTHSASFLHEGQRVTLIPTHWKGGKPMFVIRDATSGKDTYGAARFLIGEDIGGGKITLDFNKAHNPPCAFTDLAVCPLPPPQNILPFPVRAGELKP